MISAADRPRSRRAGVTEQPFSVIVKLTTWGDGAETGRSWYGLATENDGFEDGER